MEPAVAFAQEEQRQHKALKEELERLEEKIVAAKALYETYQFDQAAHARLKKVLDGMTKAHDALKARVSALSLKERGQTARLATIENKLAPKEAKLRETTELHESTKAAHLTLLNEVKSLRREKEDLIAQKRERFKNDLQDITRDITEARDVLTGLNTAVGNARSEAARLEPGQQRHSGLMRAIADAQKELDFLNGTIQKRTGDLKRLEDAKAEAGADIAKQQADFDKKCEVREISLRLREKDCEDREGTVNRQTGWLKAKEEKLKLAKRELEEIHGRELRHIVFE